MRLAIRHNTVYRYRRPVMLQEHRLMLVPRGGHELAVISSAITCLPPAVISWSQDVFGNRVALARFATSTQSLTIVSNLLVDLMAPQWPVFAIAPQAHSHPFAYDVEDKADLGALLHRLRPDRDGRLADYARSFVVSVPTDTLCLLKDINQGIQVRIAYRTRDEEGTQAPLETLALESGSCRDIAALFLGVVRQLGFAARAVSGYLHDPLALLVDAGSTHAWAEVYLPGAGWIAFDPTHGRLGNFGLVPVAYGRCNSRIMPVSGGYIGAGDDFLTMDVKVSVVPVTETGDHSASC